MTGPAGLRIEWRGVPLAAEYGMLEPPPWAVPDPRGEGRLVVNQTRIGLDGQVQLLHLCRLQLSALPAIQPEEEGAEPQIVPGSRGVGPFDGWIVDTATGHRIAWRGLEAPASCDTAWPMVQFPDGGYRIVFNPNGVTATGSLTNGEVILDSLPPKSRQRRLRRARLAGARDWGHGLLRYVNPEGTEWPPPERNRNKRRRQPSRPWDQSHAERRYYY